MNIKNDYSDIINKKRPYIPGHPVMSMENRAKIFSSFAALKGHGEAIEAQAKEHDDKVLSHI